jgi:hypothetical protein
MGHVWDLVLTSRAAPEVSATLGRGSCRATRANADSRAPHAAAAALRCGTSPSASAAELWGSCPEGRLSSSCSTKQALRGLCNAVCELKPQGPHSCCQRVPSQYPSILGKLRDKHLSLHDGMDSTDSGVSARRLATCCSVQVAPMLRSSSSGLRMAPDTAATTLPK